ncbi:GNAT family N-acetyltransferase [Streptomyces sp. HNM0575]|uniref:GNAT family N-acetyltransferase n=1 Tax=Streptomyces sp. HNM0575 TaxID=2716338 RepID=UPI00145E8E70|nr:GNAT family N-acetyltransferase [Streptomyces sp. HNM0575]NLU73558.1 GNAT family N-acetyltransferase [Streptomyces sp. HNM0575]
MDPLADDTRQQPSPGVPSAAAPRDAAGADGLVVAAATSEEWLQVEEWAAEEAWNPGLVDTACFHPTDPGGFFLGRSEGEAVSAVSVVNYSDTYAFLGYYLVRPALRGKGLGMATWQQALPHAGARTVGLDAVLAQQENYARSGFSPAYHTCRYGGRSTSAGAPPSSVTAVTEDHLDAVAAYDEQCFPAPRRDFLARWLHAAGHRARVLLRDGRPAGYGVIRQARDGHRIGPLFADTPRDAEALFDALVAPLDPDDEVHIDIPLPNTAAVALATARGLAAGFETVRMYKGTPPGTSGERVFGVTSLELG